MRIRGVNYAYRRSGHGEPLVLLHGFTGSQTNWEAHIDAFAAQYSVITVDLLGHGQSDSPGDNERYSMENAAEDLITLFANLDLPSVNLLGYSMGGRLALYVALHYPNHVQSLILESASPGLKTESEREARRRSDEMLAHRIERDGVEAFVDYWENLPLWDSQKSLPDEVSASLRAQRLSNDPTGLANSLRGMGTGAQPSLWGQLSEAPMPVQLIIGELDSKFVNIASEMHKILPHSRLSIIPDAGHTAHLEQPARFSTIVLQFLRGLSTH